MACVYCAQIKLLPVVRPRALFYIEEMKIRNGLNKDPQYKQAKKNVVDFEVTIWYEGEGLREI